MRTIHVVSLVALGGALAPGGLAAQATGRDELRVSNVATAITPVGGVDGRSIQARMQQADAHARDGYYSAARREFEGVAEDLRAAGLLPTEALWRLAAVHYAEGSPLRAVATLDDLASQAGELGDTTVRATALVEAASIYRSLGKMDEAIARLRQAMPLLDSPSMPERARALLLDRLSQ